MIKRLIDCQPITFPPEFVKNDLEEINTKDTQKMIVILLVLLLPYKKLKLFNSIL